ncbi:DUF551 domain-containing protein [Klebsiella pneumoniae]|uniref:DUF551 domain-containing protein n=1 Tax=Klebsiella pneumoniae TaxID=573 RepID=UPI002658E5CE|nr:DUF551 domain-containing protein [Klebsiella pneumoniae]
MTSKFTREELLNIIETDHVQCGEASALARMALAAMDSEPVAEVLSNRPGNDTSTIDRALPVGTQLYRHAQQPVVPPMQHWEELCREYPDMSIGDAIIRAAWWNHCRAAMLQELPKSAGESNNCRSNENVQVMQDVSRCSTKAAPVLDSSPKTAESRCSKSPMWIGVDWAKGFEPGNSPVIPGRWIPVSERMPDDDVSVLTFDGMYRRVHHAMYGHWQCWNSEKITHWMPLPAAPQEVQGE